MHYIRLYYQTVDHNTVLHTVQEQLVQEYVKAEKIVDTCTRYKETVDEGGGGENLKHHR
jgi:hypothetical protein